MSYKGKYTIKNKEKYDVKGYTIYDILKNAHTVHMWRSIMKNRHKINLDNEFDKDSLWEILKQKINTKKKVKKTKKVNRKNK